MGPLQLENPLCRARLQRQRDGFAIAHRDGGDVQLRVGQVDPLVRQKSPAYLDRQSHQLLRHGRNARLQPPIRYEITYRTASRDVAGEDLAPRIQEAWRALLADKSFLPEGGTLGYP